MSKAPWQVAMDRREKEAQQVAISILTEPTRFPSQRSQLAVYVLQTAHGNDGAYTVSELAELLQAYKGDLPGIVETVEAHIERVGAL